MKITGALVYTDNHIFERKTLHINGERIAESCLDEDILDAEGLYAVPGLVDIHFHGAMGYDFSTASEDGLREIAAYEAENGVLAICPATMSYSEEILESIIDRTRNFAAKENPDCADLAGINMEGPFINPQMKGAQNPEYIRNPDIAMFRRLQKRSGGLIKLIDIAPEMAGGLDFIRECSRETGICLAHTNADYDTAVRAFDMGARQLTHLYNAMPGIHHRQPGPVIAGLEKGAAAELIADGVHIHPAMVRFTFQIFGDDRVILISDSMEATGCPDGNYSLGGQEVRVSGKRAVLARHTDIVAGSVTNLFECMKNAVFKMNVPFEQAVRAAAENPAKSVGIDKDYGSLVTGRYANILLLNRKLELISVIKKGRILRSR